VHVGVYVEVKQLQRHVFQLQAGYYPSPKRILKAIEGKKHMTPLRKKFDIGMNKIDHKIAIASVLSYSTRWDLSEQYSRKEIT
jgi:hypothetical protein